MYIYAHPRPALQLLRTTTKNVRVWSFQPSSLAAPKCLHKRTCHLHSRGYRCCARYARFGSLDFASCKVPSVAEARCNIVPERYFVLLAFADNGDLERCCTAVSTLVLAVHVTARPYCLFCSIRDPTPRQGCLLPPQRPSKASGSCSRPGRHLINRLVGLCPGERPALVLDVGVDTHPSDPVHAAD